MKKGQLSIEVIILLSIFLLFFQGMILPSLEFAENVLKDTHAIVQTKKNIDSLSNNIEELYYSSGYGKREVFFNLPTNTIMVCNSSTKSLDYNVTISSQKPVPSGCDENGVCVFFKELNVSSISCSKVGPGHTGSFIIEKAQNGNITLTAN